MLCAAALGVVSNVATGVFPVAWEPYRWIAVPFFGGLIVVSAAIELHRVSVEQTAGGTHQARQALIDRVRRRWVDSVLERSLYQEVGSICG